MSVNLICLVLENNKHPVLGQIYLVALVSWAGTANNLSMKSFYYTIRPHCWIWGNKRKVMETSKLICQDTPCCRHLTAEAQCHLWIYAVNWCDAYCVVMFSAFIYHSQLYTISFIFHHHFFWKQRFHINVWFHLKSCYINLVPTGACLSTGQNTSVFESLLYMEVTFEPIMKF